MSETRGEHDARVFGRFDTATRRTRKGRSTFVVTGRRNRWHVGPDPVLATVADEGYGIDVDGVRLTGVTLADVADAWVRRFHPDSLSEHLGGTRPCTCDDLTQPALALDRVTKEPKWVPEQGRYVTRDMTVRTCHCSPMPRLVGTDLGRSWEELTPDPYRSAYLPATNASKHAKRDRKRAKLRKLAAESCPWAEETQVLATILNDSETPVVTVTSFPDVTIVVRRTASSPMRVTMTRGSDVVTFRARTVGAIARRVVA
jgi:hypothetical protein